MMLKYIYEDDDLIVVHKPARMATESKDFGLRDVVSEVRNHLSRAARKERNHADAPYTALINRLDQPVEGIIIVGKNKKAAAELTRELTSGQITKHYLAVVRGTPPKETGTLINYLVRDKLSGDVRIAEQDEKDAKRAELSYQVIMSKELTNRDDDSNEIRSLIRIHLITGRFHQIRVQMNGINCPIIGDRRHGDGQKSRIDGEIALCCASMSFTHPKTKEKMEFSITPSGKAFGDFK